MITSKKLPRGLRNCNPLNIRSTQKQAATTPWAGQVGSDGSFAVFVNNVFGFRAAFRILRVYHNKYRLSTIEEVINRWAPPCENHTEQYIQRVCKMANMQKHQPIYENGHIVESTIKKLVWAMAVVENGTCEGFNTDEIDKGYKKAFEL